MVHRHKEQIAEITIKDNSEDLVLTKEAKRLLSIFIEQHPPDRLSRNLRRMLLHFLMSEGGLMESYNEDLLYDLDALFNLIEEIQLKNA